MKEMSRKSFLLLVRKIPALVFIETIFYLQSCLTNAVQFTGMNPLPANVHLLTLETYKAGQLLIRLEHQYQADEDAELSQPVEVNLQVNYYLIVLRVCFLFTSLEVCLRGLSTAGSAVFISLNQPE